MWYRLGRECHACPASHFLQVVLQRHCWVEHKGAMSLRHECKAGLSRDGIVSGWGCCSEGRAGGQVGDLHVSLPSALPGHGLPRQHDEGLPLSFPLDPFFFREVCAHACVSVCPYVRMCVCVSVSPCVRMHVCDSVCVSACVRVCVRVCARAWKYRSKTTHRILKEVVIKLQMFHCKRLEQCLRRNIFYRRT